MSDDKTRVLMVLFYRNVFERKLTKSEALRQAQIEMADQGIEPYYWSPFVRMSTAESRLLERSRAEREEWLCYSVQRVSNVLAAK